VIIADIEQCGHEIMADQSHQYVPIGITLGQSDHTPLQQQWADKSDSYAPLKSFFHVATTIECQML
jgi:hypothetical protein